MYLPLTERAAFAILAGDSATPEVRGQGLSSKDFSGQFSRFISSGRYKAGRERAR